MRSYLLSSACLMLGTQSFLILPRLSSGKTKITTNECPSNGASLLLAATPTHSHVNTPLTASFEELRALEDRCNDLSKKESEFLLSFYSPTLKCFKLFPDASSNHVSITSTCMVLNAVLSNPDNWREAAKWDTESLGQISLKDIVTTIKEANWTFDSFQLPVLISTLIKLNSIDVQDPLYAKAVEKLLDQRSRVSQHRNQHTSAYLRLQNARALLLIVERGYVPLDLKGTHKIGYALERSVLVAFDEMCRQLAFFNSGDMTNFCPVILAFATITYFETSQSFFLKSFARGVIPATEMKLIRSALDVIFSMQRQDGPWPKGEPIFKIGSSKGEIGNNYVFFFDLLGCLLGPMAEKEPALFAPYLKNMERCLLWAETNVLEEMMPEDCDLYGRCYGSIVKGWRSNHIGGGSAISWCTAQVFVALTGFRKLLRTLVTNRILAEFKGRRGGQASAAEWRSLMDAELELSGAVTSFKSELEPRVLVPQLKKEQALVSSLLPPADGASAPAQLSSQPPSYSLILFGPPGTAKTTTCTSMAAYLGWNFLTIDTACFLADGLEKVAGRMTYIFERLKALDKTIILFDEIEEFCLDRENANLGMESRMLTTAMLTQLNDLRRKQSSIFIVATNRLRSFDAAVTRPGRFDMLIFLGTPNLASRVLRLQSKLASSRAGPEEQEGYVRTISDFMDSRWDSVRFLTFAENEVFLNAAVDMGLGGTLTREALTVKLQSIMKTATIQGAVKDDYLISESMSRV